MFGSKRPPKGPNCVHNDQIWKNHVYRESLNVRKFPCKWDPMKANNCSVTQTITNDVGKEKKIHLGKGSFYPLTTTGLVGWRAASNLERYGRHARGRMEMSRRLGRPPVTILTRMI